MLHSPLDWLALLTVVAWLGSGVRLVLGNRSLRALRDLAPIADPAPSVSVVVAARDEARHLEKALRSVLAQRYPALEVIAVDDRSTDATPAILADLARDDARLRVVRVDELPPGWLGKNHALQAGAARASGEWLLFTDADVVMDPLALARAVGAAQRERIDHLAVAPELAMPGFWLDLFGGSFVLYFSRYAEPWKARDPRSRRYVGIGAFNLLRAAAYRAVGGHSRIPMRPDDDLKLGKVVKRAGFRQEMLAGRGALWVEWYGSVGEAVRGLEKNSFAGLDYSLLALLGASLALLLLDVWPFLGLLFTDGPARLLNAGTVGVALATYALLARNVGADPRRAPAFPLAALLFLYILTRASALTLLRGGIRWRGTYYALDELRANRV